MMSGYPTSWLEHDRSIRPYIWSHRIVGLISKAVMLGVFVWAAMTEVWIILAENLAADLEPNGLLQTLAYFACVGAFTQMMGLPFALAGYWIERKFKLSKQNFKSWLADLLKGLALGTILGALVILALHFIYLYGGTFWWLGACIAFLLFSILLAQLAPVLFIPIFFKMAPLENSPLKERLLKLCQRFQIPVSEIYHLGLGEKTEKGNAAFVGLGKTKRIIIGDTLYQTYSQDEVEAVFAHELGHQVHNDLWKSIGLSSATAVITFAFADSLLSILIPVFNIRWVAPQLLLFLILVGILQMPLGLLQTVFSRWRERLADRFAEKTIGVSKPLSDALEKLTFQNKGMFRPNALIEFLTYSHPAPWRRITALRE